ncbi:hypothetical protein SUNI508_12410 [Seiridium unicorne]|uniref:Uncharacterized protein n=1 Tax=Seiridium unicorne TaxID=138068 RepID=A0ABR2UE37_9PEZI
MDYEIPMDTNDIVNFDDFSSRGELQDVEFLSSAIAQPEPSLLCYGAFCDIKAKLTKVEGLGIVVSPWLQFHEFRLVEKDKDFYLDRMTDDSDSKEIGVLTMAASKALGTLESFQGITFAAVLTSQAVSKVMKKSGPKTFTVDISINIMGPEALFASVGETLAVNQQYLQHPEYLREGMTYINPHYFYRSGCPSDLRYLVGPSTQKDTSSLTHQNLNKLLEHYASGTQMMADYSWMIDAIVAKGLVRSTLKSHQKEGVSFILGREDADRASHQAQSLDIIIDDESPDKSLDLALGGIYADEMGLGKTLTMLTAIVCSNHIDSQLYEPTLEDSGLQPLKATLVVVTSPQLLNVWEYEISKHMGPNVLHVGIFHGEKRAKTLQSLEHQDIILTTYHTLSSVCNSKRVLQKFMWNRVVLDEAHWIRNDATQQFKAARSLTARKRWCVTGTPIQNSMHDLRSLLAFLHVRPFSDSAVFRKHIIEQVSSERPDPFRNLRLLLGALCFRRTKDLLSLPPSEVHVVSVMRTVEETQRYEYVLSQAKMEYENIANMKSNQKKYTVLFTTVMKLRRLCSHGIREVEDEEDRHKQELGEFRMPTSKGKSKKRKREDVNDPAFCEDCYEHNMGFNVGSTLRDYCPTCSDLFIPAVRGALSATPAGNSVMDSSHSSASSPFTPNITSRQDTPGVASSENFQGRMQSSSKLSAVVDNVESSPRGHKNLVFTSWRYTLDALQAELDRRGIVHLRIDGSTSFSDRQTILSRFCEDPDQCVLLITIMTGAVGGTRLTLTAANRVHLVEPQWNPSVEDQAIARALRMGQERRVSIFKYVTKGTVEENIIEMQQRKRQLARVSLDGHDEVDDRLQEYRFVLTGSH